MKFKGHWNSDEFPKDKEVKPSLEPSQTVPDQALSVSEIHRRFASGMPVLGQAMPVYYGDEQDILSLSKLDKVDARWMAKEVEADLERITDELEASTEKERDRQAAIKEEEQSLESAPEEPPYPYEGGQGPSPRDEDRGDRSQAGNSGAQRGRKHGPRGHGKH